VNGLSADNYNEATTGIGLSAASVNENAVAGTVIGTLTANDIDVGHRASFELTDTAGGAFALISNQIVVANPALLDYESSQSKTIKVLAIDAGGLSVEKQIDISIKNLSNTAGYVFQWRKCERQQAARRGKTHAHFGPSDRPPRQGLAALFGAASCDRLWGLRYIRQRAPHVPGPSLWFRSVHRTAGIRAVRILVAGKP
jgi:hypothetical protein